jgi:hypothetical protein
MAAIIHPLLTLLASLTRQKVARHVRNIKAENLILRSLLPDRISLIEREKNRLMRFAKNGVRHSMNWPRSFIRGPTVRCESAMRRREATNCPEIKFPKILTEMCGK